MTTTQSNSSMPLRDVLYSFSLAKSVPDAELLDEYVRSYPEYAAELTDFAIEMIIDAAEGDVRLGTPTWVPGAYGFTTIARDLFDVRAEDADTAAPLAVARDGWQGFRVFGGRGSVTQSLPGASPGGFSCRRGCLLRAIRPLSRSAR